MRRQIEVVRMIQVQNSVGMTVIIFIYEIRTKWFYGVGLEDTPHELHMLNTRSYYVYNYIFFWNIIPQLVINLHIDKSYFSDTLSIFNSVHFSMKYDVLHNKPKTYSMYIVYHKP